MKKAKKNAAKNIAADDKYYVEATSAHDLDGCAAAEATGMIPTPPQSQGELNAYKAILPFSPDCYVEKDKK